MAFSRVQLTAVFLLDHPLTFSSVNASRGPEMAITVSDTTQGDLGADEGLFFFKFLFLIVGKYDFTWENKAFQQKMNVFF